MTDRYAGSEILQMAVEIEKKGKAFYDGVVSTVKDQKTRDIFQYLADEELKHEQIFQKMLKDVKASDVENPYDEREMILYFHSLIDRKIFPSEQEGSDMEEDLGNPAAAILIALSLEKDSVLYFSELLHISDKKEHEVIEKIIEEEREHIRRILRLKKDLQV